MNNFFAFVASICVLAQTPAPSNDTPVEELISAHNRERAERKLPPLQHNPRLTLAAQEHAADMAKRGIMEHEGGDHSTAAERVKRQKYPYMTTAENVARGQKNVNEVMRSWMNSPHHRDNILGEFTDIGVARAYGSDGTPFWCTEFGQPFPNLDPTKAVAEVAERLNHARSDAGLEPLKVDPRLAKVAQAEAIDTAKTDSAPKDPSKPAAEARDKSASQRLEKSGYRFEKAARCGSSGTATPEALIRALLNDRGQRETLLGQYADCGIGYAFGENGLPYWCVIIASERPAKP